MKDVVQALPEAEPDDERRHRNVEPDVDGGPGREAVLRLARRWLNRRSQRRSLTNGEFYGTYISRHPVATPRRLVNLIV